MSELAAAKLAFSVAENLGLWGEIRTVASNTFKHETKRTEANNKAGEVFTVAIAYIGDCPANHGFNKFAQWWFRMVLELLVKWDRLDKNLRPEWTHLGATIVRLEGANWYNIGGEDGEFTRKSRVSAWRIYKIGSTSADVTKQAVKLLQNYTNYLKDKGYEPPQRCCEFPSMGNMKQFIYFQSRAETMGRIRSSIENHQFTVIYGEAGIGKTTMLVEIAKQIGHKFGKVVYVAVSRSPEIFEIQKKIARQMGVPLEDTNTDVEDRAATLESEINTQDVLLLLDDVWRGLNLNQIGIPTGENVKVVIGTRMRELARHGGDDAKIPVGLLTGKDPWLFFKEAAGDVVNGSVAGPAEEVAEQCAGLPLALAVIGSTLSGSTEPSTWRSALDYLKKSEIKRVKDTNNETKVEELLCKVIEYSYEHLDNRPGQKQDNDTALAKPDKIARDIFRLCCLFPENHDISREDLKKYLAAEDEKLDSEDFDSAILRLSNWHLLQSTPDRGILKMHAVVRDVAVDISKNEHSAFINCGTANTKKDLSQETVTSNKIVSVMGSNIEGTDGFPKYRSYASKAFSFLGKIGLKAECAEVQTLLLRRNTRLHELPGSFFERMGYLTVLDLSESAIKGLPPSMDKLNKVQTLVLNGCKDLTDVGMIGKLSGLRILSLRENALTSLPKGIKALVNLVVLEFSSAGKCIIEKDFFSKLPQLKELFLASAYLSDQAFKEIIELKKMEALRLCVYSNVLSSAEFVNRFENGEPPKWSEFTMFFRKEDDHPAQATAMVPAQALATATAITPVSTSTIFCDLNYHPMSLKKKLHIEDIDTANEGVKLLLQEAEHLIMEKCFVKNQGIHSDLTVATGVSKFTETKIIHLKDCGNILYLSSGPSLQWAKLEVLELTGLEEFKGIFEGTISAGSFNKVREITFRTCKKIDCVMPGNVVQKVHEKLQKITVIGCDNVESIFANYSGLFAALAFLEVRGLVMLATIWVGVPPQGTFAKLEELIVVDCKNLVCVFTTDLVAMLTSLQKLTVEKNEGLKAIVQWDGHTALDKKVFARVTHLSMQKLGGLNHFHGSPTNIDLEWPSLVQLRLGGCDCLTRFPIGQENAPHMTLVDVTSAADERSTWYKQLEKLKIEKKDAYKRKLAELEKNKEEKKNKSIIPPFVIRVAGVAVRSGV